MSHPDIRSIVPTVAAVLTLCGCAGDPSPSSKPSFLPPPAPQADERGGLVWKFDGQIGPTDDAVVSCSAITERGRPTFRGCTLNTKPPITTDRYDMCSQGLYGQGTIVFMRQSPPGIVVFISGYDMAAALDPYLQCNSTQAVHRQDKSIYQLPIRGRASRWRRDVAV
jgi:hypothetical protein